VLQNLKQERPCDGIERSSNAHLHQKCWPLPNMEQFDRALNHIEIIVDEPAFNKCAFADMNHLSQSRCQTVSQQLREEFTKYMDQ
jgi:hypothetical protein